MKGGEKTSNLGILGCFVVFFFCGNSEENGRMDSQNVFYLLTVTNQSRLISLEGEKVTIQKLIYNNVFLLLDYNVCLCLCSIIIWGGKVGKHQYSKVKNTICGVKETQVQ